MATRAKKREVLFTVESMEHFHEKMDPESTKLLCKSIRLPTGALILYV